MTVGQVKILSSIFAYEKDQELELSQVEFKRDGKTYKFNQVKQMFISPSGSEIKIEDW